MAIVGEEIAGCIRLEDYIDLMMIRPVVVTGKHRHKGVGQRLIQSILSTEKPTGAVSRGESIPFYKTLGFLETTWESLPVDQAEECWQCPDRETCQPQPMIRRIKGT